MGHVKDIDVETDMARRQEMGADASSELDDMRQETDQTLMTCQQNERVVSKMCVACNPGQTNPAGDNASGSDTQCEPILCAQDEQVVSNMCVSCPGGTLNRAGDDASGADTQCMPVLCAQDERVVSKICVACNPGQTNPAGDNASGSDTQCEPILCAQDEQVVSNMCVSCPGGTLNRAGDDASGADTQCEDACSVVLGLPCAQVEHAYLKASNAEAYDDFGWTVALEGDTLVVGSRAEDSAATGIGGNQTDNSSALSGAVYVFVRSGGTWTQQAYLKASNTEVYNVFGSALALEGDTLAVGAWAEDSNATGVGSNQTDNSAKDSGAVYVFTRTGSTWAQQAYIKASNAGEEDNFGHAVALEGNTLAVGAWGEDSSAVGIDGDQTDNSARNSGAVYVFTRTGVNWAQQAYLKASNAQSHDSFGHAVALEGNTLAVGAWGEDSSAVGIDGDQTDNLAQASGAVYVFTRTGVSWTQQAYLKASNAGDGDEFGWSMALGGDTLAVGAVAEDSNATGIGGDQTDNSARNSGAVYVFTRTGSSWAQQAYLKASNAGEEDKFGNSLALEKDTLVAGARKEDSNATGVGGDQTDNSARNSGAVYVFTRTGVSWAQQAYLKASNTGGGDEFGWSVALGGDTLAVSTWAEDSNATGIGGDQTNDYATSSGATYVYTFAP